jgi:hypothetical protein
MTLFILFVLCCFPSYFSCVQHIIYDVIARLSPTLSIAQMKYIFKRVRFLFPFGFHPHLLILIFPFFLSFQISQTYVMDYDQLFVAMLQEVTKNALKAFADTNQTVDEWFGLPMLWNALETQFKSSDSKESKGEIQFLLLCDRRPCFQSFPPSYSLPETLTRDVVSSAEEAFLQLLGLPTAISQRQVYMEKSVLFSFSFQFFYLLSVCPFPFSVRCFAFIEKQTKIPLVYQVMQRILLTSPQGGRGWFARGDPSQYRWNVIESLQAKVNIVDHILKVSFFLLLFFCLFFA